MDIEIVDHVSSQTSKPNDHFAIKLAEPLIVDGRIVVPAGASGEGEVIHAAHSGLFGKAGELILAARYVEFQELRVPLRSLAFGKSGKDHTGTAAAVSIAVGFVPALFIRGGSVEVPPGTRATAKVAHDVIVAAPAQ